MTMIMPERGITLLPPWAHAILRAGKRLENRAPSVARRIGDWRGLIALTQSKSFDIDEAEDAAESIADAGLCSIDDLGTARAWKAWAGKLVGVAELVDVSDPIDCTGHPWHHAGQWGLILGRVWEVEPVPVLGGRGVWHVVTCRYCGSTQAREAACRACKRVPGDALGLDLRVVQECTL